MTTMNEAFEVIGKRWKSVSVVFIVVIGVAFWVSDQTNQAFASDKKNQSQDEMIREISDLTKALVVKMDGVTTNLALILQLYGIDSSKVNRWKRIPGNPKIDSTTGFPVIGSTWLRISGDHKQGWQYEATWDLEEDVMVVSSVELWDLTVKK